MSPYRNLGEFVGKIQFTTSAEMPRLIYLACLATGIPSNTAYCQQALCERLAKDLGLDLDGLLAHLPPRRGPAAALLDPDEHSMARYPVGPGDNTGGTFRIGPANTNESVR